MPRRIALLLTGAALLAAALSPAGRAGAAAPTNRPNILVIVTDDQRVDQVAGMPHTSALFRGQGVSFTNAFAQTPLCCPSRASIMTGKYTHNHGVYGNSFAAVEQFDATRTMQVALRRAGYQTGIAGKFFNGWYLPNNPPGFDRWAIMRGGYLNTRFNVNGAVREVPDYSTTFVADRAVEMMEEFQRDPSRPWFLYVAPFAPHFPYSSAPGDAAAPVPARPDSPATRERDRTDKPPWVRARAAVRTGRAPDDVWTAQSRSLLAVDRLVARLFAHNRRPNDTLAIYLSDNGYLLGEHGVSEDKRLPYPASVRVPLMLRWPARIAGGTTDTRFVLNADVAPTVVTAAGADQAAVPDMDGRSLLGGHARRVVFFDSYASQEFAGESGFPSWRSVLDATGQYTEWRDANGALIRREFYGAEDRAQLRNLFVTRPAAAARRSEALAVDLHRFERCSGHRVLTACP